MAHQDIKKTPTKGMDHCGFSYLIASLDCHGYMILTVDLACLALCRVIDCIDSVTGIKNESHEPVSLMAVHVTRF